MLRLLRACSYVTIAALWLLGFAAYFAGDLCVYRASPSTHWFGLAAGLALSYFRVVPGALLFGFHVAHHFFSGSVCNTPGERCRGH